jgi:hypothetical protein
MDAHGKQLSFLKAFKTLMGQRFEYLRKVFIQTTIEIKDFIVDFFNISIRKHLLEKRKEMPTSWQLLTVVISKGKINDNE